MLYPTPATRTEPHPERPTIQRPTVRPARSHRATPAHLPGADRPRHDAGPHCGRARLAGHGRPAARRPYPMLVRRRHRTGRGTRSPPHARLCPRLRPHLPRRAPNHPARNPYRRRLSARRSPPPALSDRAPRTRPPTDEAAQNSPHLETLRRETVEKLDHDRPANPLDKATLENLLQAVASTFGQNIGPTASAANPRRPEPNPGQQRQPNSSTPTHHTPEPGANPPDAPRRPGRRW